MDQPKPYANLARLTSLELARLANEAEQGKAEERSHVQFVALVLRACADVLEAQLTRPSVSKCPAVRQESGEHPVIVDMVPTPSGRWRAA